jgi:carboxypeptidase Taq
MTAITELRQRLATVADLSSAAGLLTWDQHTYMPRGAVQARSEQLATLSRLAHEWFTAEETGALIEQAAAETATHDPASDEASLVRVTRRDYDRERKLPTDFVAELSRVRSQAQSAWVEARERSDFAHFKPHLAQIIDLVRRKTEYLGYSEHPYDALLDIYEPEMRTAEVRDLFARLRDGLRPLVQAVGANPDAVDDTILQHEYDPDAQLKASEQFIAALGYDFNHGRQDLTAHPFCISFAPTDVRITTRVDPNQLNMCLFGTLHEMGHALYEQGVAENLARTPLARGASLGIHESQSRLWENLVGRSRSFWQRFLPQLREHFPQQLAGADPEQFYRAVNRAQPSLIRVEADELTYNLHIMLRFELELALIEGTLDLDALPEAWNSRMEEYIGLTPPNDALGVLQDIHWSGAMLGYFPTYTIGNVLSAQLYAAAQRERPELAQQLAAAEYDELHDWLRTTIHRHGRKFVPRELIERSCGGPLDPEPYLNYLRTKFGELYQ